MLKAELDRIRERISDPNFLENKGLSNEVGIHVFCYDPADELVVQDYIRRIKEESGTPYRIIECDLYEIFLQVLEEKRVLKSTPGLESKKGWKLNEGKITYCSNYRKLPLRKLCWPRWTMPPM